MNKEIMKHIKEYAIITIGCLLYAISVNYFFISNQLADGGVTGITLILYYLFKLPVGVMYFVINLPLLIIGWKMVGREFLIKTIYGTACLSLMISLTKGLRGPAEEPMLAAIYGGILVGIGLGLIFTVNASTGGIDIISRILYRNFDISMGKTILIMDVFILGVAVLFLGMTTVLYTMIAIMIATKSIDFIQDGYTKSKGVTIISAKSEEIKHRIMTDTKRGTTLIRGEGGYTKNEMNLLYCVVNRFELNKIKAIVKDVDSYAFLVVSDVSEVLGKGFKSLSK